MEKTKNKIFKLTAEIPLKVTSIVEKKDKYIISFDFEKLKSDVNKLEKSDFAHLLLLRGWKQGGGFN